MVMTPSQMLPLGTLAPDFSLPDTNGKTVSLSDASNETAGYVVMFICNHCPFVKHIRESISEFAKEYSPRGIAIYGINSNDVSKYPDDAPAKMAEDVRNYGYIFPYLFDESQAVAKAYRAACTPDFYLFDSDRKLVYRGQYDASRPGNKIPVTGEDLRQATDALLNREPVSTDQTPSIGCNIKWKAR